KLERKLFLKINYSILGIRNQSVAGTGIKNPSKIKYLKSKIIPVVDHIIKLSIGGVRNSGT
ncbi:MAG: hypothetical protein R3A12_13345, partial [Ignavibacteria bacterium]